MTKIYCAVCQDAIPISESREQTKNDYYECVNCRSLKYFEKELLKVLWAINEQLRHVASR
jgi:hypothetical protein